ncbi:transmembrane protease serine 12 [Strix uralensis]|uniref:transmembrane protease serine 12 n=1 Tax=Strix uralensis TaxID=36305 RepID=UPI003DA6DE26
MKNRNLKAPNCTVFQFERYNRLFCFAACGQRPLLSSISASRVLGGHDAQVGAWPWSVSLQIHQAGGKFVHTCGGVLVNENSVLTAGHCLKGRRDPYYWRAVLGAHNLWKLGEHTAKRKIRYITVHPEFQTETFENDIALFKLRSAVRYSDYIQPICLPPAHLYQYIDNETDCFISGWGRTAEKGKTSPVLKEAQVEIIPSSICNSSDAYGGLVNDNMICAGSRSGGTDTCQGDSGGPLACYRSSTTTYYLIGIASFGVGCGRSRFPGIYVRLSQYRGWITSQLLLSNAAVNPVSVTLTLLLTVTGVVLA